MLKLPTTDPKAQSANPTPPMIKALMAKAQPKPLAGTRVARESG